MIKINLLPVAASKKKEKIINQIILGVLVILAVMGGLTYRYMAVNWKVAEVEDEIKAKNDAIGRLADVETRYQEQRRINQFLELQRNTIQSLGEPVKRNWFIRVLDKVTESAPNDDVYIEDLNYKGGNLTVKGWARDKETVSKFMGELSIIPCDGNTAVCIEQEEHCGAVVEDIDTQASGMRMRKVEFFEKDYDKCRDFYKRKDKAKYDACDSPTSKVKMAKNGVNNFCKGQSKGKQDDDCKKAKKREEDAIEECDRLKAETRELHVNEYVKYDSIELKILTRGTMPNSKSSGYKFEIKLQEKPFKG